MFYLIRATEEKYCGLHGIEAIEAVNCSNFNMAIEIGVDMGYELIDSYGLDYEDEDDEVVENEIYVEAFRIKDEYQPENGEENDMITAIHNAALDDFYEAVNEYCVIVRRL